MGQPYMDVGLGLGMGAVEDGLPPTPEDGVAADWEGASEDGVGLPRAAMALMAVGVGLDASRDRPSPVTREAGLQPTAIARAAMRTAAWQNRLMPDSANGSIGFNHGSSAKQR